MKKNLLTLGTLVLAFTANAQVLTYLAKDALVYVSKDALVYNGGGLKLRETGKWENHGNVMLVGGTSDVFTTVDASNTLKTDGGNFYNRVNDQTAYAEVGGNNTYGQLYIAGLTQSNITGVVNQEYQREDHGDVQQVGVPFYNKSLIAGTNSLSDDFGVQFNTVRWHGREILKWNNNKVVSAKVETDEKSSPAGYYMLTKRNLSALNVTQLHEIKGTPYAEGELTTISLTDAPSLTTNTIDFGGGFAINEYNERYNTYLQDRFHDGTEAWQGDYGKNIYQFGNPFLTNLDLSNIGHNENTNGDGISIADIKAIRLEDSGVEYIPNGGSGASIEENSNKFVSFSTNGTPIGDTKYMIIRPMGTFVVKFKSTYDPNTTTTPNLNFKNLRRFNYQPRTESTAYAVTASRNTNQGTVKQLAVIGLGTDGNEIDRTYYVVYPDAQTGLPTSSSAQIKATTQNDMGTLEEIQSGGYDTNLNETYWLYINEANEVDYLGKNIRLQSYNSNIKSYRFELLENAAEVEEGVHALSQGIGFYFKGKDGIVKEIKNGDILALGQYESVNGEQLLESDLYYGEPNTAILGTNEVDTKSRTKVVYNPTIDNYVVLFDPNWKKADIKVYDMSGRLIISEQGVSTNRYYEIKLDGALKSGYLVKVVSEQGTTLTKKILK